MTTTNKERAEVRMSRVEDNCKMYHCNGDGGKETVSNLVVKLGKSSLLVAVSRGRRDGWMGCRNSDMTCFDREFGMCQVAMVDRWSKWGYDRVPRGNNGCFFDLGRCQKGKGP